jgi:hypothetical protein
LQPLAGKGSLLTVTVQYGIVVLASPGGLCPYTLKVPVVSAAPIAFCKYLSKSVID